MKKNYFTFLAVLFPLTMLCQINIVKDTIFDADGAAYYTEYTVNASASKNTISINLQSGDDAIADILDVDIFVNSTQNAFSGRTRLAAGLDASSGTIVFEDDFTAGLSALGIPAFYSMKVNRVEENGGTYGGRRTVPGIHIPNIASPDVIIMDEIDNDIHYMTRVFSNYPDEESAILALDLLPSINYPTDPYSYLQGLDIAKNGYLYPANRALYITNLYLHADDNLGSSREKYKGGENFYWGSESTAYYKINAADIVDPTKIDANGYTYIEYDGGRPSQNSLIAIPIKLTSATLGVNDANYMNVSIYPNPSRHTINFTVLQNIQNIKIYDCIGKHIITKDNINSKTTSIDFSKQTTGLYFATIQTANSTITKKIVIK